MGGGDPDPYSALANLEKAHAMHAPCGEVRKLRLRFRQHFFAFGYGKWFVSLVLEALDDMPLILVADPTLKRAVSTSSRVGQRALQFGSIDRRF